MKRDAVVAGQFYPGNPDELRRTIASFVQKPASLLEDVEPEGEEAAATLNSDLEELDRKFQNRGKKKNKKKKRGRNHRHNPR